MDRLLLMSARKAPEGPYSYPTHPTWVEHFYEAITNTCKDKGFAPLPRQAVLDGLAPALGQSEAKRVIERRRAGRFLREAACHVEQPDTDAALLLLRVDLHGAATLPWATNDRTRSDWLHPSADNLEGLEELVDQQQMVAAWTVGVERTKTALRMLAPTAAEAEKDAAEAAVKIAEDELARARQELKACEQALGGRRPLPVVRAVTEDGVALAALTAEKARTDVAAEVQRYAVDKLRQRRGSAPTIWPSPSCKRVSGIPPWLCCSAPRWSTGTGRGGTSGGGSRPRAPIVPMLGWPSSVCRRSSF